MNEATFEELQRLPGIGPKLAELIIASRPYHKIKNVLKVQGAGPRNMEQFRELVRVERVEGEK